MWHKKCFMQWGFFQVSVICAVHRVLVCPKVHGPRSISCPGCCSWSWRESGMCKCYWQGKSPWLCQDSPANRPKNRFGNPWAHGQECADSDWAPRLGRNLENVGVNPLNRPDPTTWAHVRAELSFCLREIWWRKLERAKSVRNNSYWRFPSCLRALPRFLGHKHSDLWHLHFPTFHHCELNYFCKLKYVCEISY